MAINVYFIRHGQTFFNKYHRMQGWSDTPLTAKGKADAARAGKALATIKLDYAFASDLKRTMDTARILLANHPTEISEPTPLPAFREEFFGYFEGLNSSESATFVSGNDGLTSFEDLIDTYGADATRDKIAAADVSGDAEDSTTFWARVMPGFDKLRALPDGSNVLVVSHGMTIRSIGARFSTEKAHTRQPDNGSITKLTLNQDQITVDFYSQLSLPEE